MVFGSFCAGCYAMDLIDSVRGVESSLTSGESVEEDPLLLVPLVNLSLGSLITGWYLRAVMVPPSGPFRGGTDLAFLIGLLVSCEEGEFYTSDYKVEETMLFSVEGVPEAKSEFLGAILRYTKDLEHGFYEEFFGPGGFFKFCDRWRRWGKSHLVW